MPKLQRDLGWGRGTKNQNQSPTKTHFSSFITTHTAKACLQGEKCLQPPGALIESSPVRSARRFPFFPDGGVHHFLIWLLMDKQGRLPGKQWGKLGKQTNKSNHALDLEASDRYDWSGVQLEAVTTKLRETGRAWRVSRAKDYHGVLGR